jgi:hypothetical protein
MPSQGRKGDEGVDLIVLLLALAMISPTMAGANPATGQINAAGDMEVDLECGDLIYVLFGSISRARTRWTFTVMSSS